MNNRIQRGNVAELMVAAEASKRNFIVSIPLSHNSHYDLILDKGFGTGLICVQVKRAYLVEYHRKKTLCVEGRRISGGKRNVYPEKGYDYLIACNVDNGDVWIMPRHHTRQYKAQIYLETKQNNCFKNQWSLLEVG